MPSSDPLSKSARISLIERAMQVLDSQTLELNNEQIKQIFTKNTLPAPDTGKESHPNPRNAVRPPPVPISSEADAAPKTISPWPIISNYLKSIHLQRIR